MVDFRNDFLLILRPQADQGRFSSLFGVSGVFGNIKSRCCSFSLFFYCMRVVGMTSEKSQKTPYLWKKLGNDIAVDL